MIIQLESIELAKLKKENKMHNNKKRTPFLVFRLDVILFIS